MLKGSGNTTQFNLYGVGGTTYPFDYASVGSTVAITDPARAIVNKYAYAPFGGIIGQSETIPQPFKFVGQFGVMAEPNGLYYMRARYYDPSLGRFISEDPLSFGGGDVNLMAYAGNNPVNAVDPWGMCPQDGSLKDMAKGAAFGFMAAGVVTVEVVQIVAQDVAKAVISEMIPATLIGGLATDKSVTLIEVTKGVAGDMQELAERIGNRIEELKTWWYGE